MGFEKTLTAGTSVLAALFRQPWRQAGTAAGVAVLYMAAAFLGLKLAMVHGSVTAIWPPSGIALAALLLFGPRFWPAVTAGAFLVGYATGLPLLTAAGVATGNTLAALTGLLLVRRFIGNAGPLDSVRSLLALLGSGALLATLVSATVGVVVLALGGLAPVSDLRPIWLTWWLGDAAGVMIFTPLFLAWGERNPAGGHPPRRGEGLILAASLLFTAQLVFGGWSLAGSGNYPLAFLLLPVMIWAGFRFGKRGATAAVATMSLLAVRGTVLGHGPFVHADLNESLLLLQVFMCVNACTTFILVAVLKERELIRQGLQQARDELERRVEERTRELIMANRILLDEISQQRSVRDRAVSPVAAPETPLNPEAGVGGRVSAGRQRPASIREPASLPDYSAFSQRVKTALQYARSMRRKLALLYVAIDGQALGNEAGAQLRQQVTQRLLSVVRETDTVAMSGEDEFAILLEGIKELDDVATIAERIIHELCIPFMAGSEKIMLTASAGISVYPHDGPDPATLSGHAAAALHQAREGGGRKYYFHIEDRAAIDTEVSRLIN